MRYKVFVSTEDEYTVFYCEDERQAELLYRMAVNSGMFSYVSLSKTIDEDFLEKEWAEDED